MMPRAVGRRPERETGVEQTLIFTTAAGRSFFKLPEAVQESLTERLLRYGLTGEGDVKRMVGSATLRLRDGDYRVVFEETLTGLLVLRVDHRRAIYR